MAEIILLHNQRCPNFIHYKAHIKETKPALTKDSGYTPNMIISKHVLGSRAQSQLQQQHRNSSSRVVPADTRPALAEPNLPSGGC